MGARATGLAGGERKRRPPPLQALELERLEVAPRTARIPLGVCSMLDVCVYAFVQGLASGILIGCAVRIIGGGISLLFYVMGGGE